MTTEKATEIIKDLQQIIHNEGEIGEALILAIEALEKQKARLELFCDRAEKTADGKCLGYGKSEDDDELIEKCKQCEKQSSYESENDNDL